MTILDKYLKDLRYEASVLRKKRRRKGNRAEDIACLDKEINKLESSINRFRKSDMEPRTVGSIVINYKLYDRFTKKLKGMYTKVILKEDCLVVLYGKNENNLTGELVLHDLTRFFEKYGQPEKVEIEVDING